MHGKNKPWHTEVRHNPGEQFPYFGYSVHSSGIAEIECKKKHASDAHLSASDLTGALNENDPKCENHTGQPLTGRLVKKIPGRDWRVELRQASENICRMAGMKGKELKDHVDAIMVQTEADIATYHLLKNLDRLNNKT